MHRRVDVWHPTAPHEKAIIPWKSENKVLDCCLGLVSGTLAASETMLTNVDAA